MELVRERVERVDLRGAEEGELGEPRAGVREVEGGLVCCAGEEAFEFALLEGRELVVSIRLDASKTEICAECPRVLDCPTGMPLAPSTLDGGQGLYGAPV